jgi:uncharacterized protein with HEPN domain
MRDDRERLLDIVEAIERIEKYAAEGKEAFEKDELIQNWVVHHLQVIGEAARSISTEYKDRHAEIPWNQITGMRHVLVHRYFEVDTNLVWSVVESDLPELKQKAATILKELEKRSDENPHSQS